MQSRAVFDTIFGSPLNLILQKKNLFDGANFFKSSYSWVKISPYDKVPFDHNYKTFLDPVFYCESNNNVSVADIDKAMLVHKVSN